MTFLLFFIFGFLMMMVFAQRPAEEIKPIKKTCPPHKWRYQKVLNEDGSVNHEYLVCDKCGPLHGVRDED